MIRKLKYTVLFIILLFFAGITSEKAANIPNEQQLQNAYIIGTYLFTEDSERLDTATIMLAAKTIKGNKKEDMIIYYKPADQDSWVNVNEKDKEGYKVVAEPEGIKIENYFTHIDLAITEKVLDIRQKMNEQSNSFIQTYYDKYQNGDILKEVNDSIFYMDLGEYYGEENPTTLAIGENKYDTASKYLSIGNNARTYTPVWKIKEGKLLVALPWLAVDALPVGETVITVGGQTYKVTVYTNVEEKALTISEVKGLSTNPGYTNSATLENGEIVYKSGHGTHILGVTIKDGNGNNITDTNEVIFRKDESTGAMGFTKPESGVTYDLYVFAYENKAYTETENKNLTYKLAIPGKGVITLNINASKVVDAVL